MSRKRVAVLISGRGSNLAAILSAIEAGTLPARGAVVISNKPGAAGLAHAAAAGVLRPGGPIRSPITRPRTCCTKR